jgi:hypothetical protein
MESKKVGDSMSLTDRLVNEFNELSKEKQIEVIDFVEFLKQRKKAEIEDMMDEIIIKNKEAFEELAK